MFIVDSYGQTNLSLRWVLAVLVIGTIIVAVVH